MDGCTDCNVVVSVREHCYRSAAALLHDVGEVHRTDFYNVLMLKVPATEAFPAQLEARLAADSALRDCLGHAMPVNPTFIFQTPEEFAAKARAAVSPWAFRLGEKSFHVRMHRRGFKGRLSSQDMERLLDGYLLQCLEESGRRGRISFQDPDAIIAVETVAQWAGLAFWERGDLRRYPFLALD